MKIFINLLTLVFPFSFSFCLAQTQPVIQWQRCLGGSSYEASRALIKTSDGNLLVLCVSSSNNGDVSNSHGEDDFWLAKLNLEGNLIWEKTYGGSADDFPHAVLETEAGDFVILGFTYSHDGDVTGYHGDRDCWLIKVDAEGNLIWQTAFGGSKLDDASQLLEISTGGYLVEAYSFSDDGDITGHHGNNNFSDLWMLKFDDNGNIVWQKSLGGSRNESASGIHEESDGSFIIGGVAGSDDGDVSGNNGEQDGWIIKLSEGGDLVWQKPYGGSENDNGLRLIPDHDGCYLLVGTTYSPSVPGYHNRGDFLVFKIRCRWEHDLAESLWRR